MVVIDSLTAIDGIKAEGRSTADHLIGDKALTLTRGLARVIPFFKKNNISRCLLRVADHCCLFPKAAMTITQQAIGNPLARRKLREG